MGRLSVRLLRATVGLVAAQAASRSVTMQNDLAAQSKAQRDALAAAERDAAAQAAAYQGVGGGTTVSALRGGGPEKAANQLCVCVLCGDARQVRAL